MSTNKDPEMKKLQFSQKEMNALNRLLISIVTKMRIGTGKFEYSSPDNLTISSDLFDILSSISERISSIADENKDKVILDIVFFGNEKKRQVTLENGLIEAIDDRMRFLCDEDPMIKIRIHTDTQCLYKVSLSKDYLTIERTPTNNKWGYRFTTQSSGTLQILRFFIKELGDTIQSYDMG
jgi:hypothetical protein